MNSTAAQFCSIPIMGFLGYTIGYLIPSYYIAIPLCILAGIFLGGPIRKALTKLGK
jgi:hypothetical protein